VAELKGVKWHANAARLLFPPMPACRLPSSFTFVCIVEVLATQFPFYAGLEAIAPAYQPRSHGR